MAKHSIKYTPLFTAFAVLFLLSFSSLYAQVKKYPGNPRKGFEPEDAEEHFKHTNYLMALPIYKELIKRDPRNIDFNYNAGMCYLNTNINKSLAIPYLELITNMAGAKFDNEVWFDLGKAYQYSLRFDDAIKAYGRYKEGAKNKDVTKAERQIEMCSNGKELVKYPVNVTFENMGKEVNSEFPDYYPLVTKDESFIVYTSRRKENIGARLEFDGYYPSDIYSSTVKDGKWAKAVNIGRPVNTLYDEQAVGMSSDGTKIIVYIDHIDSLGNLYMSELRKDKGAFQKIKRLNENVNSGLERTGSLSPDGEIIFFASDRKEGYGETDLYMCRKLPNGQWAKVQSLGPNVNTQYREDFPFLAEDGKTLYFSSEGHSSMGDYDLFKTIWNEEDNTWSKPVNLGYPVNTPDEDRCISFTANNRIGYVSASRSGGYGDLDIYRILFNESDQRYAIVSGYVLTGDSIHKEVTAVITATDIQTKQEQTFIPVKHSGKYVMALTPGKYAINIEAAGYKQFIDAIVIYDMGSFQPETDKNFKLEKEP